MKVYVAGPMSGHKSFNIPAFDAAAADLRERGYDVVSPAELDDPRIRAIELESPDGNLADLNVKLQEAGLGKGTFGEFLSRDVKLIADEGIEAIVVLPGWEKSKGARLETFVGRLCGLPIVDYSFPSWDKDRSELLGVWAEDVVKAHHIDLDEWEISAIDPSMGTPPDCDGPCQASAEVVADETRQFFAELVDGEVNVWSDGEERITNESTGGQKGRKPERMELLPWDVLRQDVAPLYAAGAAKYDDNNWRKGYDWSLSFGAMMRHASQFWAGEELDSETGCPHMASVVFHALALLLFAREHRELDDRPSTAMAVA